MAAGVIPPLVELLRGGSDNGRAKAAEALWNFAAGNAADRAAVVEAGALPPLVELLRLGSDEQGSKNAAGALRKLAGGNFTLHQL